MRTYGRQVYAIAAIWSGVVGLTWRDFAAYWAPVPDGTPARALLACVAGLVSLAGGLALLHPRTVRAGALAVAGLYLVYALLWSRRIIGFPAIFGTWAGTAEELAQVLGGAIVFLVARKRAGTSQRGEAACIVAFGLCAISFGIVHFDAMPQTAAMVPAWLPAGGHFWAALTGICDIAAGLALMAGVLEKLAARLLTIMFAIYGVLIWIPNLFAAPEGHMVWAGNGVNLALVASAWIVADRSEARRALPRLFDRRASAASTLARGEEA